MRISHILVSRVLPALAVFLAGGWLLADTVAPPVPGGSAFVDIQRCLDEYPAAQVELDRMRARWAPQLEQLEATAKTLRDREGELASMDPESSEFAQLAYDLDTDKGAYQRREQYLAGQIESERLALLVRAYKRIHEAAGIIGRREGAAAVLVLPEGLDKLPENPKLAFEAVQLRHTLWANPAYDVTDKVIEELGRDT